jgi:hypothetical protein
VGELARSSAFSALGLDYLFGSGAGGRVDDQAPVTLDGEAEVRRRDEKDNVVFEWATGGADLWVVPKLRIERIASDWSGVFYEPVVISLR